MQLLRRNVAVLRSLLAAAIYLSLSSEVLARQWVEEDFWPREVKTYTFTPPSPSSPESEDTLIGEVLVYQPEKGDTFFDLARFFDLGYNELVDANPGVDEWIPGHFDKPVIVPQQFILPYGTYNGIVINVPEMRLYYYRGDGKNTPRSVITFPVGLGREEWKTPIGKFKVTEKTVNPTWVIPESIRKERIAEKGYSEKVIPGGSPNNPLGKYRMRLSLDLYGIHGTNIPWGVGMLVSHGCVRLYPEDIEKLFPMVPVGTPGVFVYQPVKIGMSGGRVFVEVHKDLYGMKPGMYRETVRMLEQRGLLDRVDEEKLREAVLAQSGMPVDVTLGDEPSSERPREVELPSLPERPQSAERAPLPPRDAIDRRPPPDTREVAPAVDDLADERLQPASGRVPPPPARPVPSARRPTQAAEPVLLPTEIIVPRSRTPEVAED
ncbi:MAG TPA: L,D-transpeptidase family protein [Candidatus Binatia bacterium]